MPKEFSRTARVSQQLQKELAFILQREISDPKIAMTTISGVDVSRDLAYATVFVTFFCLDHQTPEASLATLKEKAPYIRKLLGKRIRLRLTPELRFEYDSSLVEGMRMSNLITQVVEQDELGKKSASEKDSNS